MACGEPAPRRKAVRFSLLPIDCPGYTPSLEISTNYYDFGVINGYHQDFNQFDIMNIRDALLHKILLI
jgi:hypothetical protein